MSLQAIYYPIEILLVEDNPGDVRLTQEALKEGKVHNNLNVVADGVETMAYLRHLDHFIRVVQSIEDFWLTIVKLPPKQD